MLRKKSNFFFDFVAFVPDFKDFTICHSFKTRGRDTEICCSVEEVEDRDTEEADIERLGAEDNLEDEARNIKVIETDFKRPLRSSFRAKKGEKR